MYKTFPAGNFSYIPPIAPVPPEVSNRVIFANKRFQIDRVKFILRKNAHLQKNQGHYEKNARNGPETERSSFPYQAAFDYPEIFLKIMTRMVRQTIIYFIC